MQMVLLAVEYADATLRKIELRDVPCHGVSEVADLLVEHADCLLERYTCDLGSLSCRHFDQYKTSHRSYSKTAQGTRCGGYHVAFRPSLSPLDVLGYAAQRIMSQRHKP